MGWNPELINGTLSQVDWEGFHRPLGPETGVLWWLGVTPQHKGISVFRAGISWSSSLQEYCSGGVASHSGRGADGEVVRVVLTVAALFLTRFMGLELSFSSSLDVKKRSDMEGVEVERLSIL